MLGAFADADWRPVSIPITPATVLVLYSDGVIDAVGPDGHFGERRLEEVLTAASTAEETVARVRTALADFQVGTQADDIAMLAAQRTLAQVPTPAPRNRMRTFGADAGSSSPAATAAIWRRRARERAEPTTEWPGCSTTRATGGRGRLGRRD
jgi:hypothetical protein